MRGAQLHNREANNRERHGNRYSKHERTEYRKLAEKYPAVCSVADVDAVFALPVMIDLYFDVVKKSTEWPLYDQSIKTLAQYLGFRWRDAYPSGAASIEWYNRWLESHDLTIKQRILDYNEDDCLARVLWWTESVTY